MTRRIILITATMLILTLACSLPGVSTSSPTAAAEGQSSATQASPVESDVGQSPEAPTLSNPAGVVIAQDQDTPGAQQFDNALVFVSSNGTLLGQVNTPGLDYVQTEDVHIAGTFCAAEPCNENIPPIIFFSFNNGGQILLNEGGQISTLVSVTNFASLLGVPGQSTLTYSTADYVNNGMKSQLFFGTLATLPGSAALVSLEGSDVLAIVPLGLQLDNNTTVGIWYTQRPWGIGGDIVFDPTRGLWYYDLASGLTTEYASPDSHTVSMSPDLSWIGVNSGGTGEMTIYNLYSGQYHTFGLLPASDRGAGDAVFSPSNQYVAWMEGSGWLMAEVPDFYPTVRIGTTGGALLGDYTNAYYGTALGVDIHWVVPVGWLDEQTVVLQVRGEEWVNSWVIKMDINNGNVSLLAPGSFAGFYYP